MCAERLNARQVGREQGLSRFVALVHTEGCGLSSSGATEQMHLRTMMGYAAHPLAQHVLLLEHGCEKTHNDYMRNGLEEWGLDPAVFRLGLGAVGRRHCQGHGQSRGSGSVKPWPRRRHLSPWKVAWVPCAWGCRRPGNWGRDAAQSFAQLTRWVVTAGGTVVVPAQRGPAAGTGVFGLCVSRAVGCGGPLPYGQAAIEPGFYIMETPTDHWVETATGLGATGVDLILAHTGEHPLQGHPLMPVVQVSADPTVTALYGDDIDLALTGVADDWAEQTGRFVGAGGARRAHPRCLAAAQRRFSTDARVVGGFGREWESKAAHYAAYYII